MDITDFTFVKPVRYSVADNSGDGRVGDPINPIGCRAWPVVNVVVVDDDQRLPTRSPFRVQKEGMTLVRVVRLQRMRLPETRSFPMIPFIFSKQSFLFPVSLS